MCGIIGIADEKGNNAAKEQVAEALKILHNRGKDDSKIFEISSEIVFGHALHSVVEHVSQPLKKEGVITANCEIYNWMELAKKYDIIAKNDADLLLSISDKFGLEKINELDGVFAFGYYKDGKIYLARDILGVKPLWYVCNDAFAFASE